ncbi:MAG: adenylate kinase family protein, partial [Candidatus Methanofastidiosia archaeon]
MRIAVTGTPGVGKTYLCKKISNISGLRHLEVLEFAKKFGFISKMENENTLIIDEERLQKKFKEMNDILIDSHFSEIFDVDLVIVLRCEPITLFKRLKERRYDEKKLKENVLSEMLDYNLFNALRYHREEDIFEILNYDMKETISEALQILKNPKEAKSLKHGSKC